MIRLSTGCSEGFFQPSGMMSSTPSNYGCHPEYYEGSPISRRRRHFAALGMTKRYGKAILLFVLALLFAGCDGGAAQFAPVTGKVSYQGVPLRGGTIVFVPDPDRGNNGPLAKSSIQPDGKYLLKTGDIPGAMPGWYRVTVIAVEEVRLSAGNNDLAVPRSLVPEKYRDPQLSDLTCEVKPGQENGFDFNLQ